MLGNKVAPPLTVWVGVSAGIGGVFVIMAAVIVGVLVFIDITGGGRFVIMAGGMGVRFVTEVGGKFGLGVLFISGVALISSGSSVELTVGV
tara:strand:- start:290 stop:562 length:273 start_codon:yes stop_codon:yes gene_type:complete